MTTIADAAAWLRATPRDQRDGPTVPALRSRFGLTPREAVEAIRLANETRFTPTRPVRGIENPHGWTGQVPAPAERGVPRETNAKRKPPLG